MIDIGAWSSEEIVGVVVATFVCVVIVGVAAIAFATSCAEQQVDYPVTAIYVHPIKACRGTQVEAARLDQYGLEHDRRWVVVRLDSGSSTPEFMNLKKCGALARIVPTVLKPEGLLSVAFCDAAGKTTSTVKVPLVVPREELIAADKSKSWELDIYGVAGRVVDCGEEAAKAFTTFIRANSSANDTSSFRLVRMAGDSRSMMEDKEWADLLGPTDKSQFQDYSHLMIASDSSLTSLNEKLIGGNKKPARMEQFRPNIVVKSDEAFSEDNWRLVDLVSRHGWSAGKSVALRVGRPCSRCQNVAVDAFDGTPNAGCEPLSMLKTFRLMADKRFGNSPIFGLNMFMTSPKESEGAEIRVGDVVTVRQRTSKSLLKVKEVTKYIGCK